MDPRGRGILRTTWGCSGVMGFNPIMKYVFNPHFIHFANQKSLNFSFILISLADDKLEILVLIISFFPPLLYIPERVVGREEYFRALHSFLMILLMTNGKFPRFALVGALMIQGHWR